MGGQPGSTLFLRLPCRSGVLRGKLSGWLLKINHDYHQHPTLDAVISPCASPFFGLSSVLVLAWCSEATQLGTDTYQMPRIHCLHLGYRYSLPSTYLLAQGLTTRLPPWSCTLEHGRNHFRPRMLKTRSIPPTRRTLRFSFRSLAPESSGLEILEFDTASRTSTLTVYSSGLWILGTRFRGGNNGCSGTTDSLVGDIT